METIESIKDETLDVLEVQDIAVSQILANRYQPRTIFEEIELSELAESIKQHGLLQPIVLRKVTSDMFEIVAGERRFRAVKLLELPTVPALVKEITATDAAVLALIENIQREDLTAVEEARSYEQLAELFGKTQSEIAEMVGKSQSAVANKIRLLQLSDEVQKAIDQKQISERHGRALLKIKDHEVQNKILTLALEQNYTVATLEAYIERYLFEVENPGANKNNILGIAKDTRLAVNTINKALKTIEDFGMDIAVKKEEQEEHFHFEIVIPKNFVEKVQKQQKFAHEKVNVEKLSKVLEETTDDMQSKVSTATASETEQTSIEEKETTKPMILDLDLTSETVFDFTNESEEWLSDDLKKMIHQDEK